MEWDGVIIGAGPAGMSAAITASRLGLRVAVIDRQQAPGGQIFRNVHAAPRARLEALGKDYARGKNLTTLFFASSAEFMPETTAWHLVPGRVYVSGGGKSRVLLTKQIIIATGGMERPLPVPGWTLPGVLGVGAADTLLKSGGMLPDGPVIFYGNGPLILQAAEHYNRFRIPVAGIALTNGIGTTAKAGLKAPLALARPLYTARGVKLGMLMLARNRLFPAARKAAIEKTRNGFALSFTGLGGRKKRLEGAAVLLHAGVVSETRITRLARCRHVWDARNRYWHAASDVWGATGVTGIGVAGDCAGVLGADASIASGALAALDAARLTGRLTLDERNRLDVKHQRDRLRCVVMQDFLGGIFAPDANLADYPDETVVCRCEGLTAGVLRQTILSGCFSEDGLKAQSRCGMGACQGRMCSAAAAELIANAQGIPLERLPEYHAQFPLVPLSMGELATMDMPPAGL